MPYVPDSSEDIATPDRLSISSYNVLAEFIWPPSQARYPLILDNILSDNAAADIVVLQEVTDDFLSYLLGDDRVRETFDFVSHGPPEQLDIEPLPSLLNIVILSKWAFEWEYVSFSRKHKGSVVARFKELGKSEDGGYLPLILAGIHLSQGLNDGAVTTKKLEIQRILNFLSERYPKNPWVIAGDTNISTSSYSIETAISKKAISEQSATYLANLGNLLADAQLTDAWEFTRHEIGDASDGEEYDDSFGKDVFDGERGATYDPTTNEVAAKIVGSGFNMRPQRYDRILVRARGLSKLHTSTSLGI